MQQKVDQPAPISTGSSKSGREFLAPSRRKSNYLERRLILDSVKACQRLMRTGRVLDVGCGTKPYRDFFHMDGHSYWGVDFPASFENCFRAGAMPDIFANCLQLPFKSGSFDAAVCTQVLEHVKQPQTLLDEIGRILKPDGTLLLSAPMTWPLHEEPFDFYRYTIHGLRHMIRSANLKVLEEIRRGVGFQTLAQIFLDVTLDHEGSPSVIRKVMSNLTCLAGNLSADVLERLFPRPRLCLGWTIVAKKIG